MYESKKAIGQLCFGKTAWNFDNHDSQSFINTFTIANVFQIHSLAKVFYQKFCNELECVIIIWAKFIIRYYKKPIWCKSAVFCHMSLTYKKVKLLIMILSNILRSVIISMFKNACFIFRQTYFCSELECLGHKQRCITYNLLLSLHSI